MNQLISTTDQTSKKLKAKSLKQLEYKDIMQNELLRVLFYTAILVGLVITFSFSDLDKIDFIYNQF